MPGDSSPANKAVPGCSSAASDRENGHHAGSPTQKAESGLQRRTPIICAARSSIVDAGPAQIMPIWVIKIPPTGDVVAHS
jgi:hypothetical protein